MELRLQRDFFTRSTLVVTRELLGQRLVRIESDRTRLSGIITETEAYIGAEDQACHARAGRTPRNQVMWSTPGVAYVYFTYGMHWLLNFVTEPEGAPAVVLVRAIRPVEGVDVMRRRRGKPDSILTDGPAKLCQALALDGAWNGHDLCSPDSRLFVEAAPAVPDSAVRSGPRVGLYSVPEPWKSIPWRFRV